MDRAEPYRTMPARMAAAGASRARVAAAAVLAACGLAASPARAQGAADEERLFRDLPQVEAASRYGQSTADAPSSVTVVTARDIERHGWRTLGEVLQNVRGMQVSGDRNYSYLSLRGFSRAGDWNSRVLLLVDGQRMNDNVYDNAGLGEDGLVDMAMVDRVEVIRGPSSSVYGPNAIFGVINVVTRRGRDLGGAEFAAGVGSRGGNELRASVGARPSTDLEYLLSAGSYGSHGDRRLYIPRFDAPATNRGVSEGLDGEQSRRFLAKLRLGGFSLQAAGVDRDRSVPTASWSTVFNDNRYATSDQRGYVEARYEGSLGEATEFKARAALHSMWYRGAFPYGAPRNALNNDWSNGSWLNAEFAFNTRLGAAHRLAYGLERQQNRRTEQGNSDNTVFLLDQRRSMRTGAFVQHEWRVAEDVVLNNGLRLDRTQTGAGVANPRLAAIWHARPDTTLKLMHGRAYRAPNAYELYYHDGNQTQMANPLLKPERVRTTEGVLEHEWAPGWRASLSAYEYRLTDAIQQVTDAPTGLLVFRNTGELRTRGYEAGVDGRAGRVELQASLSVQAMTVLSGPSPVWGMARSNGKLLASAPLDGDWLRASVALRYLSPRSTLTGSVIPSTVLADMVLLARPVSDGLRGTKLTLGVYNLFDRRHFDPGASEHTQDRIEQYGRSVWLRLEQRF